MNQPIVRLVLAVSLDGRLAIASGGKANLGREGDRKVLEEALTWSDATLMGSGTLRAHKNTCLIHDSNLIRQRKEEGKDPQPASIIITQSANFCSEWEYFKQPIKRLLLKPKLESHPFMNIGFDSNYEIKKTWSETLFNLYNLGFYKIALLGGMKLIKSILLEDNIDELQLTVTPRILGGNYTWIDTKLTNIPKVLTENNAWLLKEIKNIGNNEIMLLYKRNKS